MVMFRALHMNSDSTFRYPNIAEFSNIKPYSDQNGVRSYRIRLKILTKLRKRFS